MNMRIRLLGCLGVMLSAHAIPGQAAFFQLAENSPAGLGNAFAGGAAIAEDASTVWYNPAGLTRLGQAEYLVGGHFIFPSTEVQSASGRTLLGTTINGSAGGDAGEDAIVPNFYYARRLDEKAVVGFGVTVPFGLATEYDPNWVGRYHAVRSEVRTINLNPGIGYKFSDQFSVGGGINVQYVDAELTQKVDFGTICNTPIPLLPACSGPLVPSQADGSAKVTADDISYGFNLGLLWSPLDGTRIGFAYRSKISHKLEGDFEISEVPTNASPRDIALGLINSGAMAYVTLPETLSLSVFHQIDPVWSVMADVTRTRWSRLPELRIDFDSTQRDSVVTFDLEDVNRYSVGANYRPGGTWTYRFGVAFDQSPTPNETVRTPRTPDEDRTWFAFGAGYQHSNDLSFDVAFVHIKIDDASINKTATATNENIFRGNLTANYEADVNILSAQARWAFK